MSTPSGADKVKQQSVAEVQRIAQLSWQVRQALRQSLPAPPEQFFTVMVPGKVLNLNDYTGGYDANGYPTAPLLPRDVQLAEAILCDDMPALAGVQLGPTGKSVSRSYAAALDKLTPSGTTIGVLEPGARPSADEKRHMDAMDWLLTQDRVTGKTHIQNYIEKQKAYNEAYEKKVKDFNDAEKKAKADHTTVDLQRDAYDRFVAENARVYRSMVQAAFMDWVVVGKKEEVEYWFAVVDHDSILSRVEASKEAMRLSTVSTTDGSTDYQTVNLSPSNWAWLALQKGAGSVPKVRTVEWYTWEITRLSKLNLMLEVLRDDPPTFGPKGETPAPPPRRPLAPVGEGDTEGGATTGDITATKGAIKDYIDARLAYDKLAKDDSPTSDKAALKTAFEGVKTAQKTLNDKFRTYDQDIVASLKKHLDDTQDTSFTELAKHTAEQIAVNRTTITAYIDARQILLGDRAGDPANNVASELGIPTPAPDPASAGVTRTTPDGRPFINPDDFWTSISVSVAESYDASQSNSSSNSYSVGGGASWGLWSVGGSVNHSDSTSKVANQMAHSSVSVTFDCLRVDIARSWLRSELFYDSDITVTKDSFLSPGPMRLSWLMDPGSYDGPGTEELLKARNAELARYALLPLYPTAFLLAANVVMEIKGESSDIQSYFHTSSTSGSASVGWGPFSVSSSFSHTDTQASSSCEATATGCRITTKGPQIIGWISQILPALPRISA